MKNTLHIFAAAIVCGIAFTAFTQSMPAPPALASRASTMEVQPVPDYLPRRNRGAAAGGFVEKRGDGDALLVIDRREAPDDLRPDLRKIMRFTTTWIDYTNTVAVPDGAHVAPIWRTRPGGAGAVIEVASLGMDAPTLAIYPENRAATVNVDMLAADGADTATVHRRLVKELWRSLAFILGGYASDHPCALKFVDSPEDLDGECLDMTCPPVNFKVGAVAKKVGIAPALHVAYSRAVKEGWAPPPTNDLQRAVWEEVHSATNAPAAK